ncbi:unnamed protein product [Phaedon cochleariae]|uniref:Uncharacterized protein n=1 Tax=Phaedon cochleariae TaxID=80249 RepID=A0A9N9SN74_PHACE|nr:unnamed protein product [Phaedon cochleariae]
MAMPLELCRSCFEPSDKMYPLVGSILNVDVSIATMLEYCISSKLNLSDKLPSLICLQCFKTIRIAYLFLLKFQETQEKVNKLLTESDQEVKNEINQEYISNDDNEQNLTESKVDDIQDFAHDTSPQIEYEIQESDYSDNENVRVEEVVEKKVDQYSQDLLKTEHSKNVEYSASYKCPKCDNKFGYFLAFQRHIINYHSETITCTRCPDKHTFKRDEYLAHYKQLHRFECDICNKRMSSGYGFQYHIKIHQNDKKYVCTFEGCTRSFLLKDILKKHMLTHTEPRTYPCHLCDRVFRTLDMYRYHIRHHDGKRNFLCTYCGRTFVQAVHLRYHVSKHIGERPYICELCAKSFHIKPALTKHLKGCMKKHNKQKLER